MSSKAVARRRGPKTPAGKLAVSHNASKHGILSPRPVVMDFESEGAWKSHRQAILDSLVPEGGIEQALAERAALCSWRLNRVAVYETELIAAEQERVVEEVKADRKHKLKHASVYAAEVRDIVAGSPLEKPVKELLDEGGGLSNYAIELLSAPEVTLEAVGKAREHYETVCALFNAEVDTTISRFDAAWLIEKGPYYAVEQATFEEEERHGIPQDEASSEDEITETASALEDKLWERVGEVKTLTVRELKDHLAWVAQQAGMQDASGVGADGTVANTPLEGLLERLRTVAVANLNKAAEKAKKVEEQLVEKRRARILPDMKDLEKIGRYEAHLSRELYRALHELEALQTRRGGGAAPLGRLDVQF